MIRQLNIENFALIEKLSMDFPSDFSIITGETGAGKSILLGALGLALGKRADLSSLKDTGRKCIIEAHFAIGPYELNTFFDENDLDYEDETILRREILPSGKSRAFVNDSPVSVQQLQELGSRLLDIHSQHQTLELSDEEFQFRIIDAIGGNSGRLSQYAEELSKRRSAKASLSRLREELQQSLKEHDYNVFLLEELSAAKLADGQQETLEAEFEELNNSELIRENLTKAIEVASNEEFGLMQLIGEARHALQRISGFSVAYAELSDRLGSAAIEIDDILSELSDKLQNVQQDPKRLDEVGQALQTIYNLQKKHGVATVAELIGIQSGLESRTLSAENLESEIAQLESGISQSEKALDALAVEIHDARVSAIPELSQKLSGILKNLGMPDAQFRIGVSSSEHYFENGKDELSFLFSANKGGNFGTLKKVASGGELSRIMLAVKSVLAEYSSLPTIVFDEIDTGVSGEIAHKMGEIMKAMSATMQVFSITHLPQIAAKGDSHYKVVKKSDGAQTTSELQRLEGEERVREIAQMLSGSAISDSAINHARALLN